MLYSYVENICVSINIMKVWKMAVGAVWAICTSPIIYRDPPIPWSLYSLVSVFCKVTTQTLKYSVHPLPNTVCKVTLLGSFFNLVRKNSAQTLQQEHLDNR